MKHLDQSKHSARAAVQDKRQRRALRRRKLALPFFSVLFCLAAVSFILPLRPTQSMREKRALAEFPAFSAKALFSGDYFDGITTWYSDTFPGREGWLDVADAVSSLHGISKNVVNVSGLRQSDPIPTPVPAEALPSETPAPSERTPEATPEPTPEVVEVTPPPVETITEWGGVGDEDNNERVYFGADVQIGDTAYEAIGFNEYLTRVNAELCNRGADIAAEYGARFFDMPAPGSLGVMLSSSMLEKLNVPSPAETLDYKFSLEHDNVLKVNAFNNLVAHNTEYLYFRTDHHWTALGAYYAYEAFCRVAGFDPVPLSEYTEVSQGDFLGSFYSTAPVPGNLRTDEVIAYDPPGNITMKVYNNGSVFDWTVLTDLTQSTIFSKYMTFLGGDHAMTVITNNDLPDAPDVVVYKDSYGNPFVIYLAQHYHHVYALDYRKYDGMTLRSFIQNYGIEDVIMAESMSKAMGMETYNILSMRIGY